MTEAKWWEKLSKEHLQQDLGVPSGWSYKQCFLCFVMYPASQEIRGIWSHHVSAPSMSLTPENGVQVSTTKTPLHQGLLCWVPNIPNWAFHKAQRKEICWSPELKHSREHMRIGGIDTVLPKPAADSRPPCRCSSRLQGQSCRIQGQSWPLIHQGNKSKWFLGREGVTGQRASFFFRDENWERTMSN